MSEAAPSIMAQSWPWHNQIAVEKKFFLILFFLYEIYGFYYINKNISELPLQTIHFRLKSKKCFFSWGFSYFFLHVVSSFLLSNFSSYLQKNSFFIYKMLFLTYRENNFCRLAFVLLHVSLTRTLKYQKILIFFWELKSVKVLCAKKIFRFKLSVVFLMKITKIPRITVSRDFLPTSLKLEFFQISSRIKIDSVTIFQTNEILVIRYKNSE